MLLHEFMEDQGKTIPGEKILKMFHRMHTRDKGAIPEMEEYIRSHEWMLTDVDPNTLPDADGDGIIDPFNRIIEVDPEVVKGYVQAIKSGSKLMPIVLGPNNAVIDGNHRATAYKILKQDVPAYVPVEQQNEFVEQGVEDAVVFHDELNPAFWDNGMMKPMIRYKLLQVAMDFVKFIGIKKLSLTDVIMTGSNASYNYTKHSDVDLHLVVKIPNSDVFQELYDSKKGLWNEQHNVKVKGFDVEVYVQDSDEKHISSGMYSILNDEWIKEPQPVKPKINDMSVEHKYHDLHNEIEKAVQEGNKAKLEALKDKIKKMRQSGLDAEGEFSAENLAFKMLRNLGDMEKLMNAIAKLRDQELSIEQTNEGTISEMAAFHGSFRPRIGKFKPFSHFGSEQAARERMEYLAKNDNRFKGATTGYLYKLDLGMNNPVIVKDYPNLPDISTGSMAKIDAWSKDIAKDPRAKNYKYKEKERTLGNIGYLAWNGYWREWMRPDEFLGMFVSLLRRMGIDGLAYKNKIEHKGEMSYIAFDPESVRVVGRAKPILLNTEQPPPKKLQKPKE